jgi:hypothetical protein
MASRNRSGGSNGCLMFGLLGCGGMVALGVVLLVVVFFLAGREAKRQQESIAEADKLYAAGKKVEAVAKYKDGYAYSGSRKAELVQRIVDHEAGQGKGGEAKKWLEKGLDDKLTLTFETPAAKMLLADVQKEREQRLAQKKAEEEARDKQREADREAKYKKAQASDAVKANRSLPRDKFRNLLLGKGPDDVIRLIGKADKTIDTEATGTVWYYYGVAPDLASKSLSTAIITWDGAGLVKDVEFI